MKLKKAISIVLAAVCALSLSSCGNSSTTSTDEKTVITVWSQNRHDMDVMTELVDEYNKENTDNIEIKYEVKADGMGDQLQLAYQSGEAPDIHSPVSGSMMRSAVESNWLRELPEEELENYKNNYVDGSIRYYPGNGKPYSVATSITTYKLIWDKDLFEECGLDPESPPKTWDEVIEYAKIITDKGENKKYGFALPMKDSFTVLYYIFAAARPSGLKQINGFDVEKNTFDFSTCKDMLEVYNTMREQGSLFPTPDTLNNDTARAQFAEGNVGMMAAATYDIGVYNDQFPAQIDFGVTDFPTFDGSLAEDGGYAYDMDGGFQMNANSKHPEEQLKVYNWLISEEVLARLAKEGLGVYSHKNIVNNEEYINKDKKGSVALSTLSKPYAKSTSLLPHQLLKVEGDGYMTEFQNILSFGADNIDERLEALTKRYNDAFAKLKDEGFDIETFRQPDLYSSDSE